MGWEAVTLCDVYSPPPSLLRITLGAVFCRDYVKIPHEEENQSGNTVALARCFHIIVLLSSKERGLSRVT